MPSCKNDKRSSYTGHEPSPKGLGYCAHAEEEGKERKGKDGAKWIVGQTKNGVKRWIKLNIIGAGKKYYVYDNGIFPFMVIINKKHVTVYREDLKGTERYVKKVLDIDVERVIVGKDGKYLDGNSILLKLSDTQFICVTDSIFRFEIEKNDTFIKYFSTVGNSDVPYPVLLGKYNFYSMIDRTYGSRKDFPDDYKIQDFADAHSYYYGKWTGKKFDSKVTKYKLPKFKILHKRIV